MTRDLKWQTAFFSLVLGCVFFAVLVALSGCSGRNVHGDLTTDLSQGDSPLVRKWVLQTREEADSSHHALDYSNPILVENTLIFGNSAVGLVSIYPIMNQQRWALPIPGGVISEIVHDRGALFFGGGDGFLYSVNAENGRVNWRYELRNPMVSRPVVQGGRVFVTTTDDTLYAFDAGTGKWLWHYRRRTSATATIRGASAPLVDGNEVLAGLSDGFLVAVSLQDGQLKWERKLHSGTKFTDVDAQPVLDAGVLYMPSYDGALYSLRRQGGEVLWRFDAGGSKQVEIEDQRIFFPSTDGHIYCLQKNSGKVLWKFEMDQGAPTRLVLTDRFVIVGSSFQYLYVIDKNTGQGLYRYNVGWGSGFAGAPAYDAQKGRLYFLSGAGNLYAFAVKKNAAAPVKKQ